MSAEIVYRNGYIYTADKTRRIAEAVAIEDGRYTYVGSNEGVEARIGTGTEIRDLDNRMLMPSFFEGHCHYTMAMPAILGLNLAGYNTTEEYVGACRSYLGQHPGIKILRGQGYLEACFPGSGPRREDLDRASDEVPIILQAETLHSLWANSAAIRLAGVTADTPDPRCGRIERREDGTPSGCFRESAQELILRSAPDFTVEQYQDGLLTYQKMCHRLGVTGSYDAWLYANSNAIEAMKALDRSGKLSMHLRGAYWADPTKGPEQVADLLAAHKRDCSGELVRINAIKCFLDGVVEDQTAYLHEPYVKAAGRAAGWRGEPIWEADRLNAVVAAADRVGLAVHMHCLGDAAVTQGLDALAHARATNGKRDARHCITHIYLLDPKDIKRFRELDVVAMTNSYWFEIDEPYMVNGTYLGPERAVHNYPEQCLFAAGVTVANASDYPITAVPNPFVGIELGVTRIAPDNYHPWVFDYSDQKFHEPLWQAESAGVRDMIASFTSTQAYANFLDDRTGSVEVGKDADLIVVDRNIVESAPEEIGAAQVEETLFHGRCVYER